MKNVSFAKKKTVDKDLLEPGCTVLLNNKSMSVVGILNDETDPMVNVMKVDKAPLETYADIGGLDQQVQEIKESVELPMTHPEIYQDIGISPPKGVILYGPPGTGKTLLAKAVANQTAATFLRVVGSELIQKYLGDGPKLVRELFRTAEENAPSIVFIDEIDAIGTKRYESTSGGEREIQRTMLELLNQLDGFDERGEVKVIMATNRIETLDPALLRPGRLDRKIEFPLPDLKTKQKIFDIHTKKMTLSNDVSFDLLVSSKDDLSGADIKAMCTEAGLLALRERRMKVTLKDFEKAKENILYKKSKGLSFTKNKKKHHLFDATSSLLLLKTAKKIVISQKLNYQKVSVIYEYTSFSSIFLNVAQENGFFKKASKKLFSSARTLLVIIFMHLVGYCLCYYADFLRHSDLTQLFQ
ncbi:putative 26S ATPase complex subunit 4 [Reticulomyxa filosa]|uniref:Putative 26S ATPase complex subunit 4 n=1 Tax=Reticulomyxa filosa TaxID=46433 RepID=X6M698_RETFI|nr:putative 26S ATPase complex subunit 4 [Reticulomyxa filosa]|eukprot:ETO09518.1 putative 26S ATPase complex subunit 4 [Reticulomyxa filosa]